MTGPEGAVVPPYLAVPAHVAEAPAGPAGRFFDGGAVDGSEPVDRGRPMQVRLERVLVPSPRRTRRRPRTTERFAMERRIAYQARGFEEPHVVPVDGSFRSDLTSVPSLFTWLVPRTGSHLPAALLHDGLVHGADEPASYLGPRVDRTQADRIFREAMADLGTGRVRRWLMWTAVSLGTVAAGLGAGPITRWYHRGAVFGSLAAIVVLGVLATADVADVVDVLPWMGRRNLLSELVNGAVAAVLVPVALSALWRRLWAAGMIAGVSLAVLLHVTLVLAVLTGFFAALGYLLRGEGPR